MRRNGMPVFRPVAVAALLAFGAVACHQPQPAPAPTLSTTADEVSMAGKPGAAMAPRTEPAATAPPAHPHEAAGAVLARWARAIERRDWAAVRALWGDQGGRSGLAPSAFAARWSALEHPRVTLGPGEEEGAAGSLYYSAPVTIRDGARTVSGRITLRRVNDVPGASAEQLRWHVEQAELPGLVEAP